MAIKDKNRKPYRIYLKQERKWAEVSEEVYREHTRFHDAYRKRQQFHERCACPKGKFWLCDADCLRCEFRRAGDTLSLDYETSGSSGERIPLGDMMYEDGALLDEMVCDHLELRRLFDRLEELMPEALTIGRLREQGLSDEAIATEIGIKRTTFRSRLGKAKQQLTAEFPDCF